MDSELLTGSCLCGELRFAVRGQPHSVGHCHCRQCQKFAGAPFATWATFRTEQVEFSGRAPAYYASSARALRGFCGNCGSSVSWQKRENPRYVDLCVALFDQPERLPPGYAIWTASRLPWLHVDEHLPQHLDGGPDVE